MEIPPRSGNYELLDVHGAGAQRSDPKTGDPSEWPRGNGPQGDVVRIFNYVRCVRTVTADPLVILRFDSKSSLTQANPERTFYPDALPWLDPDDVLGTGAAAFHVYRVPSVDRIVVAKEGLTIRIEAV